MSARSVKQKLLGLTAAEEGPAAARELGGMGCSGRRNPTPSWHSFLRQLPCIALASPCRSLRRSKKPTSSGGTTSRCLSA